MRPPAGLSDATLLERVQKACFSYFWDHAHPACHLARDRSTRDVVAIGGSGMSLMCHLIAHQRRWVGRRELTRRLGVMLEFLKKAERLHGMWGHFANGGTGAIVPFYGFDDGADLQETALLAAGLICVRQYFAGGTAREKRLSVLADELWRGIDWASHLQPTDDALYWHWSPNHGFAMKHWITGWNECLIAYLLAAASPTHQVPDTCYFKGWTAGQDFFNGNSYYGLKLPLGPPKGGPLFFAHYSFLGIDPRDLRDSFADYHLQNLNHTLINRAYCIENPKGFAGYGPDCWGLTASDSIEGYAPHEPRLDLGVIAPTAALSSMPYTPELSLRFLRHLLAEHPDVWGEWGFRDAFSPSTGWIAQATLAIDQGPIIIMIENHRTQLMWKLMMSAPEIASALTRLEFASPWLTAGV